MQRVTLKKSIGNTKSVIDIITLSTGYKITRHPVHDQNRLLTFFTVEDYNTQELLPYGYQITKQSINIPKIPKGLLQSLLNPNLDYRFNDSFGYFAETPLSQKWVMKLPLYPKQKKVSDIVVKYLSRTTHSDTSKSRYVINMPTGEGKTFTVSDIISRLGARTIVIVKNTNLQKQFYDTLTKQTSLSHTYRKIVIANGSDLMELPAMDCYPDVLITTHNAMLGIIKNHGYKGLIMFMLKMEFGTKVYDEFDYNVGNMLRIDTRTSVKNNIYLSATDYRSSQKENKVFKQIFIDVPVIGKDLYSDITPTRDMDVYFYKGVGLPRAAYATILRGGKIDSNAYNRFLLSDKVFIPWLRYLFENTIDTTKDKIFFFVGLKESTWKLREILIKEFKINPGEILVYHSDIKDKRDISFYNQRFICTITNNLGRGTDVSTLDHIVNIELIMSKSYSVQTYGRVGRNGNYGKVHELICSNFGKIEVIKKRVIEATAKEQIKELREMKVVLDADDKLDAELVRTINWTKGV